MVKKVFKTAIYCRLSREDSDKAQSNSIVGQKAYCKEFVLKNTDLKLVCEPFVDDGYSGVNFDRPNFIKMFTEIQKGNIDCVVVRDLSRFARNYIDSGRYLEKIFPSLGVRFIAINDNYDSGIDDNMANLFTLPFKNLMNEAYCKDISIKIRSSLETQRKRGEFIGAFAPYGYKKSEINSKQLIVDNEARRVVLLIYSLYKDGLSIGKIAKKLNEMGVLSPFEHKHSKGIVASNYFKKKIQAMWEYKSVRRILTDEVYTGVLAQGKTSTPNYKVKVLQKKQESEWIRVENTHEAIVSREDFCAVKELLSRDMRSSTIIGENNVLSGFCFCADCLSTMKRRKRTVNSKFYYYYVCSNNAKYKKCTSHNISMAKVEEHLFKAIHTQVEMLIDVNKLFFGLNTKLIEKRQVLTLEMQIESIYKEISAYQVRKIRLYQDFADEIISKVEYKDFSDFYTNYINKKNQIITKLEKDIAIVKKTGNTKNNWAVIFKEHENFHEINRRVLMSLIDRVLIHENHCIEIIFKYKDVFA